MEHERRRALLKSKMWHMSLAIIVSLKKRFRCLQVHAYIISALHKEMPALFRKDGKKKELIKNLGTIYQNIQKEQQISPGDFPDLKKMQVCKNIIDFCVRYIYCIVYI